MRLLTPLLALALCLTPTLAAQSAPQYPPLTAKETAAYDAKWKRFQERRPNDSVREIYDFILSAAATSWRPQTLPEVIDLAEELHERDASNKGYGNYRWYWHDAHPDDMNAGEFCMQTASLAWNLYRQNLTAQSQQKLEAALRFGAEGIIRHKVEVSYTNIFLMRISNAVLIGQSTNQPQLVDQARGWLGEWLDYTRQNGLHEFNSPTYYGVDLNDLGCLARYAQDPQIRDTAARIGRFLWTDIAADWFEPHQAIAGASSRDYGFLIGHGYLDQQLTRAGWLKQVIPTEANSTLDDAAFLAPPEGLQTHWGTKVRILCRRYGPNPDDRAYAYIGHHVALGSAGSSYGAQDRMIALTFDDGPRQPIGSFSFDYRDDPYGQGKIQTSGGHPKLTHLRPFLASVQNGPEALQVGWIDPAKTPNPAGKSEKMTWSGLSASFVLPRSLEVWDGEQKLAGDGDHTFAPDAVIYLREGAVVAAVRFIDQKDEYGSVPSTKLVRDADALKAERFSIPLAAGKPLRPVSAGIWIRVQEDVDEAGFKEFRAAMATASAEASAERTEEVETVSVSGLSGTLRVETDPKKQRVRTIEGADPAYARGILVVNGQDLTSVLP